VKISILGYDAVYCGRKYHEIFREAAFCLCALKYAFLQVPTGLLHCRGQFVCLCRYL